MDNKFCRAVEHLTKTSDLESVLSSLEAVEDLFTEKWLNLDGDHRLQQLWHRRDRLATSELYAFGKAIKRLEEHNRTWLESSANEIKKNTNTSHGLITEIIVIGSLSTKEGVVAPCPKSYPIYDYTINFKSDFKYKVSIKNFDISIHEKAFKNRCGIIRKTFKNHLRSTNRSGTLQIISSEGVLTEETVEYICSFIVFNMKEYGVYPLEKYRIALNFQEISWFENERLVYPSDTVMILAKQHHNEQRNIESKITSANRSMLKDHSDRTSIKKLIIRLGETTDIKRVKSYIEGLAEDYENCGFDICLVLQPVVASDSESTQIVNTFHYVMKRYSLSPDNLPEKLGNMGLFTMELGVGSLSTQEVPLVLMDGDTPKDIELSDYYVYQQGDIYQSMKQDKNGYYSELEQPIPGVTVHAVYKNVVIKPVVFGSENKLMIV